MDAQALLTPDAVDREMGRPLAHVPDQGGDATPPYARYFAAAVHRDVRRAGHPSRSYYWMSDLYPTGQMDPFIRTALDNADDRPRDLPPGRKVQQPGWLPLSVICENCGKVGTTLATDWDGKTVAYACSPTS